MGVWVLSENLKKGLVLRVHSSRCYYLFPLHRLGAKVVNDRLIRWLYKRYSSMRASSPFGRVARRHARASRWRRRECEGWRKKRGFSFFSTPCRSRFLSRLASFTTRNGELPRRLAVQGMWIYTGGSDVNRLRLTIKGQHVWRIIPYFNINSENKIISFWSINMKKVYLDHQ